MITPSIWCNGSAEEQLAFYGRTFRSVEVLAHERYPTEGLPEFQQSLAGQTLFIELAIHGVRLQLTNAGPEFRPTPAISFLVNFDPSVWPDAREYLSHVWSLIGEGGMVRMPLGEYPHSAHYGWVEDKWGVNWQLMLTDPSGSPRPAIVPNALFVGAVTWRAREAAQYWIDSIPGSSWGRVVPFSADSGVPEGAVLFSDFQLQGTWLSAMDGGPDHDFSFGEGVSLVVEASDQAELDAIWSALSAVPEAEACGWCKDRFGVSWQVVPANLGELMASPGAHGRLMGMKKIIIADLAGA